MSANNVAAINRAVKELTKRLKNSGQTSKKQWWERYLKQTISFYGTPMGDIRTNLHQWWKDEQHQEDKTSSTDGNKNVKRDYLIPTAWELFKQPIAEQKLCAILILQELAIDDLDATRDLPIIAKLFDDGYIYDWNTTDWLCVRVLGPWIQRDTVENDHDDNDGDDLSNDHSNKNAATQISSWVDDAPATLWRQRASLVSFVNVENVQCIDLQFEVAAKLALNSERFAQTAIGWVIRERSKLHSNRVVAFIKQQRSNLSSEAINMASAKLSDRQRSELGLTKKRKRR